jgi:Fe-coproporphyrin III synthase
MDVSVISTYRCNSKCSMCYIWQNPTDPREEISLATLAKLPSGIDNLNVSGGEPTLRNDLPEIVDLLYSKAKCFEISSNGLHSERLEPIVKKHPDIKVRFSLEGFGLTNDAIRGEEDGFNRKVAGLKRLKELGGKDLGFGAVIQDDNYQELVALYRFTRELDVEFATSTLHNGFQFHKGDNFPYDRKKVAKGVENLIIEMLKTWSVKTWFRAYLNLGLMEKILGRDRLIPCTAATDFIFVDPWSDVYACNVRPDLKMGNLEEQNWDEIIAGDRAKEVRKKVATCSQNCWMVTTARTAMRNPRFTFLPKMKPLWWVFKNKVRLTLGLRICFDESIDIQKVNQDISIPPRASFLGISGFKRKLQKKNDLHYNQFHNYFNR